MRIKILGTGCFNCRLLEQNTKEALGRLGWDVEVEKVTEIQKIMSHGIMSVPALVVDETVLVAGRVPGSDEIKEKLMNL